jgi:glycosyltransferase involved in cell wall biosynthesis
MLIRLLIKCGHKVTVIAPGQPHETVNGDYRLVLLTAENHDFLTPLWFSDLETSFLNATAADRPDFIFSEGYYALGLEKVAAGVPIFAFIHNFHLIHFNKLFTEADGLRSFASYFLRSAPRTLYRMLSCELPFLRRAAKVVSVSERNAGLLKKFYRLDPDKVSVLHNWVETGVFRPDSERRASARWKLGLAGDRLVFLLVGALWRPKGFQTAIKAFKRLAGQRPEAVLLLAGEGPYEQALKNMAGEELLASGRIKFLGLWRREELPALYNAADIFIIPSIHPEGLAYTLIEAMASGLASIATSLGGNIETIGNAGILLPPGNTDELSAAMLRLAQGPALRKTLSELARDRALELFSEEPAAKKIGLLLER